MNSHIKRIPRTFSSFVNLQQQCRMFSNNNQFVTLSINKNKTNYHFSNPYIVSIRTLICNNFNLSKSFSVLHKKICKNSCKKCKLHDITNNKMGSQCITSHGEVKQSLDNNLKNTNICCSVQSQSILTAFQKMLVITWGGCIIISWSVFITTLYICINDYIKSVDFIETSDKTHTTELSKNDE